MDALKLMTDEHKYIKQLLKKIREKCLEVIDKKTVDTDFFYGSLEFIRKYADKHHHGKEEDILFGLMTKRGGELEKNLINAMDVEHNLGRLYVSQLEEGLIDYENGNLEARLDIISNAMAYVNLLHRHIDKEDNALYNYARRTLTEEDMNQLNRLVSEYEHDLANSHKRDELLEKLKELTN